MLKNSSNLVIYLMFILSFLGFLNALYLTFGYFYGSNLVCFLANNGCQKVLEGNYSQFLGLPIPLLGSIFFLTLLFFIFYFIRFQKLIDLLKSLIIIGFIFSVYLLYLQAFVVKSWCIFCLFSAFICFSIFILMFFLKRGKI